MRRRGFLVGLVAALAAPVIIRPGILMPIRGLHVRHAWTPCGMMTQRDWEDVFADPDAYLDRTVREILRDATTTAFPKVVVGGYNFGAFAGDFSLRGFS